MTINKKIFLLFSSLFIVLLSLIYFILKDREEKALVFEEKVVKNKIVNLHNILKDKNEHLKNIIYEYSKNETIINTLRSNKNLNMDFFDISSKVDISYFVLLNNKKDIVYSEVFDISSKEYLDIDDSTVEFFKSKVVNNKILAKDNIKFAKIDYERLIFSMEKVDDLGYIFVGRVIDSSFLSQVSSMIDAYVSLLPSYEFKKHSTSSIFSYDINRVNNRTLYTNIQIQNKVNNDVFFFSIKINRDFYREITVSNKILLELFFLFFLIFILIIYTFISKIFTERISHISKTVKNISKKKDLVEEIDLVYDDEITYLSNKMNEMFKVIHDSQNENIKKERDFLQSVLDSQQHIIFITDGNKIQSANKKFIDVFKNSSGFLNNIAILDNETKSNLLKIAKKHSSIDKPAKFKFEDKHKYFVFDISRVELKKYIICMNDVSKYNERITHLENKASIDELTACYNKNTISDYCRYWLDIKDYALIVLDIDKFKSINDNYGHFIGDCILRDLSSLLRTHLHSDDLIGRFGGEEFILAINTSVENIMTIANRIRVLIEEHEFIYKDIKLSITASLGCTYCYTGESFDELFKTADEALYHAKNTGRNRAIYKK